MEIGALGITPPAFDIERYSGSPRLSIAAHPVQLPPLAQFSSSPSMGSIPLAPSAAAPAPRSTSIYVERQDPHKRGDPLWKAAQEFEAVMLSQMFGLMMQHSAGSTLFGGGQAEKIYQSFLIQAFGESVVEHGGVGMAEAVYRSIAIPHAV